MNNTVNRMFDQVKSIWTVLTPFSQPCLLKETTLPIKMVMLVVIDSTIRK